MKLANYCKVRILLSAALCLIAVQSLMAGVFPGDWSDWFGGNNETLIPVARLYPGTYILEIASDGASQTFKVMIR